MPKENLRKYSEPCSIACPHCSGVFTDVKDSRMSVEAPNTLRRRRMCRTCGFRFTTFETYAETLMIRPGEEQIRRAALKLLKTRLKGIL